MKSFFQRRGAVILSSIMDMEDDNRCTPAGNSTGQRRQSASQEPEPPGGAGEEPGTGAAAGAAPACGPQDKPPRQLLRNLKSGLRLSLALRVAPDQLRAGPGALALLVLTDFALNLAVSFLLVGRGGYFALSAVPSFFFHLPLLLFFGFLAGRILSRPSLVTAVPVALVALSIPIELCHGAMEQLAQLGRFRWLEDHLDAPHYFRFYWWWAAAALLFLLRLQPARPRRGAAVILLFLVLPAPLLWFYPRGDLWVSAERGGESGELRLTEEVLAAQGRLLDAQLAALLPGRKGVTELYFVGFAGDATQDVFLKELTAAQQLFRERFGTAGRSVVLANNPRTATTLPFASAGNLERALSRVGRAMNRDEDVLFLYLTSHGSREHELSADNRPLELDKLTPEKVRRMLKKSGIAWKVVVVSACYAGGFVEPLQEDRALVITAADATHESFGCGYGEDFTWFGEAFLDDALRRTLSFTEAFEMARQTIRRWEEEQGETPSNPQIRVGRAMGQKLRTLEKQQKSPATEDSEERGGH